MASLPLLLPLFIGAIGWLATRSIGAGAATLDDLPLPLEAISAGFVWLWFSLLYGGLPYLIFIGVALWRLRGRSEDSYFRFSLFAPLLFAAFLAFAVAVVGTIGIGRPTSGPVALASICALFAAPAIPIGYLYVGITHAVRAVLARRDAWRSHPAA